MAFFQIVWRKVKKRATPVQGVFSRRAVEIAASPAIMMVNRQTFVS
jgi:hypothetical protein